MSFRHQRSAPAQYYLDTGGGDYMEEDDSGIHMGHPMMGGSRRLSSSSSPAQGGRQHSLSSSSGGFGATGSGTSPTKLGRHESFEQKDDYQDEAEVQELLTKATVTSSDKAKLENLMRVKEIIINKQPTLLDNFLNEMLDFQLDNNADVRCYILEFIEDACKTDPETIPKVLHNMMLMLKEDKSVTVQKKTIQVTTKLYKYTLMWLCRSRSVSEEMEAAWNTVCELKKYIVKLIIDSDHDGIRTYAVKFIEAVVLLQTATEPDSFKGNGEFCLDDVPITVRLARPRKLEEDARNLFEELLKFHASRHATSVNLLACMGSIVMIAKMRPHLMGRVVTAMEKLIVMLPPTLARSQVTSVKKFMKVQLIGLLRHSKAIDFYDNITTLLSGLGATNSELNKALPNWDQIRAEKRKRQRAQAEEESNQRKRARIQEPVTVLEDSDDDEDVDMEPPADTKDLNEFEKSVFTQLKSVDTVVDLVMKCMHNLPERMPNHFSSTYTPVDIAETDPQVRHVARLLAAQITAFQLGPEAALQSGRSMNDEEAEPSQISTVVSGSHIQPEKEKKLTLLQPSTTGVSKKKIPKSLKLSEVTKPLTQEERQRHMAGAVKRILQTNSSLNDMKIRLVCSIAANSTFELRYLIMQHVQEDIKNRLELGISWLFTEYSLCQDFVSKALPMTHESTSDRYEWTFFNLMKSILDYTGDSEKTAMAWKLYIEPPSVPEKGLDLLKALCGQTIHAAKGMLIFQELALKRPNKLYYLHALLHFCVHALEEVRSHAVSSILHLYEKLDNAKNPIEDQVQVYCNYLRLSKPPEILFSDDLGRSKESQGEWNDDLVKACLALYLKVLNIKSSLIHELASVYVETTADVKRSILRYVETPVRSMGMDSPELMKLLDTFPKGAETIITKIIHILTDKTLPSTDLVTRVRNLYAKRVSDVRFLIPVLNGLTKQEILTALPKLIKLNPVVVKEVFNRLLGIHVDAKTQHASPITPEELMVALHNIDGSKCDVKTVIKATTLCFNEADVYTPEVLAIVINQLMEQSPLPTLLMRTVIQTLALHAKLHGFIMNTLGRLVKKEVWTQPKVWEGFVKCCQRTVPKSSAVLLMLPATQLQQALDEAPDLRQPLENHLLSLTPLQRSCLPPAILSIVLRNSDNYISLKEEAFYGDYEGEVTAIGGNLAGPSTIRLKDEPGSPTEGEELVMSIKDEPHEYQDE